MADDQIRDVDNRQAGGNRTPKYAWPEKPVLIGTSIKRLDGPDKVTGRAKYTFDIARPGSLRVTPASQAADAEHRQRDREAGGREQQPARRAPA